jgi:hypothetical protein
VKRSQPPKRSALPRPTLEQVQAWQRKPRKRIPRKSAKRVAEDERTFDLRASVSALPCLLRSGALLDGVDLLIVGGGCGGPGTPHHLAKSGQGGPTTAANLVPLCARHNGWVESDPPLARTLGLVVRPGISPEEALRRRIAAGLVPAYYALPDTDPEEHR